jgi:hypothetical protein
LIKWLNPSKKRRLDWVLALSTPRKQKAAQAGGRNYFSSLSLPSTTSPLNLYTGCSPPHFLSVSDLMSFEGELPIYLHICCKSHYSGFETGSDYLLHENTRTFPQLLLSGHSSWG